MNLTNADLIIIISVFVICGSYYGRIGSDHEHGLSLFESKLE